MKRILLVLLCCGLVGCGNLQSDRLVLAPESPALILQVKDEKALVAVYSKERNEMVEYGWIKIDPGLTLTNFSWEKYIASKKAQD